MSNTKAKVIAIFIFILFFIVVLFLVSQQKNKVKVRLQEINKANTLCQSKGYDKAYIDFSDGVICGYKYE